MIGGGLSGLAAAATLRAAGQTVQLLEAGAQVGGRIRALRDPASGEALADLGPTWVWPPYQPVAARWIKTLGVGTFAQFNEGDAVITGYAPQPLRQPLPGQDGMVRIVGGPSALVDALAARVGADNMRLLAPVAGIAECAGGGVCVALASGEVLTADRVILSVPLRVAASTLHLPWAPPDLLDTMRRTPTWMAPHAKAVALYDRPFWREKGLSGRIASRTGPLVEAHDHCGPSGRPAALFGFVGWPPEARRTDPEGLQQAILNQLSECFGPEAARPNQLMVEDWASDPHIATDLDLVEGGAHPDLGPSFLRQWHLDGRLRLAVSEVSDISPGLIEGALAAGERAALDLVQTRP